MRGLRAISRSGSPETLEMRRELQRIGRRRGLALEIGGAAVAVAMVLAVFLLPLVIDLDPYTLNLEDQLKAPSAEHLLGTDVMGRDYLARILSGGRISIAMGLGVVAMAGAIGLVMGSIAGFAGGVVDEIIMRIGDVFLAFPRIILALVVAGALGPNMVNSAIAIAVAWWPAYARIIRGQVIVVREREYVLAGVAIGASWFRRLFRTVVPNSWGALKSVLLLEVGAAIIAVATLSFFGLGVQAPDAEWGLMVQEGMANPSAWWLVVMPGLAVMLFAAAANLAGGRFERSIRETR